MANTHIEFTQHLLDHHQPGRDARAVLADWGTDMLRNERPDIFILTALLYDGFSQVDISKPRQKKMIEINDPAFLLQELLYRYVRDVLGKEFIEQSTKLFDQAEIFRRLCSNVTDSMRKAVRDRSFSALHRDSKKVIDDADPILRDVYLMGDAKRILFGMGERKIRPLFQLEQSVGLPSIPGAPRRVNPFNLPMFAEITKRIDEAHEAVDAMSNKELSIRLLRSFKNCSIGAYSVDLPVYGVKTIFAYTPILVDRLMNNWSFDNKPVMKDLSDKMAEATIQLTAIKQRFERVHASPELG